MYEIAFLFIGMALGVALEYIILDYIDDKED